MAGIRARRVALGLSVEEAAGALGVTRQGWNQWELGSAMPSARYLPAMAELLRCRIEELYGEGDGDG